MFHACRIETGQRSFLNWVYLRAKSTGNFKRAPIFVEKFNLSKIGQIQPRYGYHKKYFSSFALNKVQEIIVTMFLILQICRVYF